MALTASVAWGVSDFIGGLMSRSRPPVTVLVISQGVSLLGLSFVVLAFAGVPPAFGALVPALLGGLAIAVGLLSLYRALAIGPMSVVAPLFSLGAVVTVLFGFASGDRPSALQGVGIVVAVTGCFLAARSSSSERPSAEASAHRRLAIIAALLAAGGLGLGMVGLDAAADTDPLWALAAIRGASFVTIVAIAVITQGRGLMAQLRPVWPLPMLGALDLGANVCFAYASTLGLLAVVGVLASVYPAVTVLLAAALLHERMRSVQGVGVLAAFGGVVMLVAG